MRRKSKGQGDLERFEERCFFSQIFPFILGMERVFAWEARHGKVFMSY